VIKKERFVVQKQMDAGGNDKIGLRIYYFSLALESPVKAIGKEGVTNCSEGSDKEFNGEAFCSNALPSTPIARPI
jgi:hypothetical protein